MEQRPSLGKPAPVEDSADRTAQYDARFRAAVEAGLAEADRGDLLDHEEVVERIERILRT